MDKVNRDRIEELASYGYELQISDYISEAFALVRENLGVFAGFALVSFIISSLANFTYIGPILISAPLSVGYIIAANKARSGYRPEFGDFFKGFDFFGPLVVYSLIWVLIIIALAIPVGLFVLVLAGMDGGGFYGGISAFIFGIGMFFVIMYLAISFIWAPHLIVFGDMKAGEAMQSSQKLVKNQFSNFLGFGILLGLINLAGALCFGIGLLFTVPATAVALYIAFEDVTQLNLDYNDDIEKHLVD